MKQTVETRGCCHPSALHSGPAGARERLNGVAWWQEQPADEELATLVDSLHLVALLARESGDLAPAPLPEGTQRVP